MEWRESDLDRLPHDVAVERPGKNCYHNSLHAPPFMMAARQRIARRDLTPSVFIVVAFKLKYKSSLSTNKKKRVTFLQLTRFLKQEENLLAFLFEFLFQIMDVDTSCLETGIIEQILLQRNIDLNPLDNHFT